MPEPVTTPVPDRPAVSRRRLGRLLGLGVPAAAVLGAAAAGPAEAVGEPAAGRAKAKRGGWSLRGNRRTTGKDFLGTADAKPLAIRTANLERARFGADGRLGVGTRKPAGQVGVSSASYPALVADYTGTSGFPAVQGRSASGPGGAFSSTSGPAALAANDAAGQPTVRATNADASLTSVAVQGYAAGGTADRVHPGGGFYAGAGEFSGANGIVAAASPASSSGYGVVGLADNAFGVGVYARGLNGAVALRASGNVDVLGTLTKSGGSFRIDHPLAPATKYLSHSFVESPDMKNIYDGVVTADAGGTATVVMPDWFDALNRDLRYQLTALGGAAPQLHVATELTDLRFTIAGAQPHQRISWQVTGTRRDAWAEANRIPVEEDKPAAARGRFLHPEAQGRDASLGLDRQVRD